MCLKLFPYQKRGDLITILTMIYDLVFGHKNNIKITGNISWTQT